MTKEHLSLGRGRGQCEAWEGEGTGAHDLHPVPSTSHRKSDGPLLLPMGEGKGT